MKFTLCVPTYNEEIVIVQTLRTLLDVMQTMPAHISWEIVVADNGSSDGTAIVVEREKIPNTRVCHVPSKGKGLAIRTAAQQSDADFFGFIDADLSADPESIVPMLNILVANESDLVVGSRLLDRSRVRRGLFRTLTSQIFNLVQSLVLGVKIKDTQCGLKLMNKRGLAALRQCREDAWFFDVELLALASRAGLRVREVPVTWEEFRYANRAAKITIMRDGFLAILAIARISRRLKSKDGKRSL